MKFFFTIAFAFIVNTFECQTPYSVAKEVLKIYRTYVIIDKVATDLTKNLNLNPISLPRTHISRLPINQVGIPKQELSQFKLPTTDNLQKLINPVVKFNTEDLSKYRKSLASSNQVNTEQLWQYLAEINIENEKEMNLVEKENMNENIVSDFKYWRWTPDPADKYYKLIIDALSPMNTPGETIMGQINNGKYGPLAATNFLQFDMNQIINNSYSIDNIFNSSLNKNSSSTNSNKFKPNPYQSLMLTRDENGFFKIGQ